MEKQFDFENVGKRMPYRVPEDFFANLESKVMSEVAPKKRSSRYSTHKVLRIVTASVMGVAASAAVFCAIYANMQAEPSADSELMAVEQAFSALNSEDQAYLLDNFQQDVFMDESLAE